MTSAFESILDDVASWTPTYDSDVSIGCWNIDDIKPNLENMSIPKRVLMVTEDGTAGEEIIFVALGKTMSVTWFIRDRLYLANVGEMASLRRYSGDLVRYAASYVEQIRQNRSPTAQSHILNATARPGIFEWGGKSYFGVDIVLEIQEIISGA